MPSDVKRYFVSLEESPDLYVGMYPRKGGEVFYPKLGEDQMLTFFDLRPVCRGVKGAHYEIVMNVDEEIIEL